jgi:hypothetical protein
MIATLEGAVYDAEIAAFARQRGLDPKLTSDLRGLVSRFLATAGRSVLTTMPDAALPALTLDTVDPAANGERYERLGLLGSGGMREVWRVRDRDLNRTMAMKVIRAELMERGSVLARFIEEAQCSAQLQHPGIAPVHELGRLPGGEFYFTMREVRGRTLSEVIATAASSTSSSAPPGSSRTDGRSPSGGGSRLGRSPISRPPKPDHRLQCQHPLPRPPLGVQPESSISIR